MQLCDEKQNYKRTRTGQAAVTRDSGNKTEMKKRDVWLMFEIVGLFKLPFEKFGQHCALN